MPDYDLTLFILLLAYLYMERVSSLGWLAWDRLRIVSLAGTIGGKDFATLNKHSFVSKVNFLQILFNLIRVSRNVQWLNKIQLMLPNQLVNHQLYVQPNKQNVYFLRNYSKHLIQQLEVDHISFYSVP